MSEKILVVKDLKKYFKTDLGVVKAVDGVSFSINSGETLGLVGESGSGKSTTAFTIMGVYAQTEGEISFKGKPLGIKRTKELKKDMQMVFQDPGSSLNPRKNVKEIIQQPLKIHQLHVGRERERVEELLRMVGLPTEFVNRYPRAIGGGEKQLVAVLDPLLQNVPL